MVDIFDEVEEDLQPPRDQNIFENVIFSVTAIYGRSGNN